jgi:hypothetical protein
MTGSRSGPCAITAWLGEDGADESDRAGGMRVGREA